MKASEHVSNLFEEQLSRMEELASEAIQLNELSKNLDQLTARFKMTEEVDFSKLGGRPQGG